MEHCPGYAAHFNHDFLIHSCTVSHFNGLYVERALDTHAERSINETAGWLEFSCHAMTHHKTDLLLRRRMEQKRQEAQRRRDGIRKPIVWLAIVIILCFGCCLCPIWSWIWEAWLAMIS